MPVLLLMAACGIGQPLAQEDGTKGGPTGDLLGCPCSATQCNDSEPPCEDWACVFNPEFGCTVCEEVGFDPPGTACGGSSAGCDALNTCDGGGSCIDRVDPAGTTCRAASGTCDVSEVCNGVSKTCPANVGNSALCVGNCDVCGCDATSCNCAASSSFCTGNCDVCAGSGNSFNCAAGAAMCTGNCDVCSGSGTSFNCGADTTLCTGSCDVCSGSGTSFNCGANAALCSGNCDVCAGAGTNFSCLGDASLCTGNCDACSGSGDSFNCASSAALCTGNCDVCSGSGTSFNCAASAAFCGAGCDTCTGVGTAFNCGCVPLVDVSLGVDLGPNGEIVLSWSGACAPTGGDFEIYQGAFGSFNSHHPMVCTTGGMTSVALPQAAGNVYYLVVPRSATMEGSYGVNSSGLERPQGTPACLLQDAAADCQ